ncbi:MAG TPA: peroxiredoxin [Candidatus Acidoferrum sp.]|jgi:peroxiredoxin Q/BCP|nr:peroxiredoxin [Candidatus Acidoferrum sp.]
MLKEGDPAPKFGVIADDGSKLSLADYKGQNLVLYFYPKANTSGCTHESVDFRDALKEFKALNTAVVGCSGDSAEDQTKFKVRYKLNFPLLADTEFEVVDAYKARRMKSFFGKSFLGIVRSTFWIGPDGKIRKIWPKVTPKGHAAEVLEAIQQGAGALAAAK